MPDGVTHRYVAFSYQGEASNRRIDLGWNEKDQGSVWTVESRPSPCRPTRICKSINRCDANAAGKTVVSTYQESTHGGCDFLMSILRVVE